MSIEYYYKQMAGWMFTKNGNDDRRYSVHGLGYRGEPTLKIVREMEVGDVIKIYGYKLKRVE